MISWNWLKAYFFEESSSLNIRNKKKEPKNLKADYSYDKLT